MAKKRMRTLICAFATAATAFVAVPAVTTTSAAAGPRHMHAFQLQPAFRNRGHWHPHWGPRWRPGWGPRWHRHYGRWHRGGGDAAAALLGLGGLAIIGGALAGQSTLPYYANPNYQAYQYQPVPTYSYTYNYGGALQPWSPGWYQWCNNHYKSFNPRTGTFRGYDGQDHFCSPR